MFHTRNRLKRARERTNLGNLHLFETEKLQTVSRIECINIGATVSRTRALAVLWGGLAVQQRCVLPFVLLVFRDAMRHRKDCDARVSAADLPPCCSFNVFLNATLPFLNEGDEVLPTPHSPTQSTKIERSERER